MLTKLLNCVFCPRFRGRHLCRGVSNNGLCQTSCLSWSARHVSVTCMQSLAGTHAFMPHDLPEAPFEPSHACLPSSRRNYDLIPCHRSTTWHIIAQTTALVLIGCTNRRSSDNSLEVRACDPALRRLLVPRRPKHDPIEAHSSEWLKPVQGCRCERGQVGAAGLNSAGQANAHCTLATAHDLPAVPVPSNTHLFNNSSMLAMLWS